MFARVWMGSATRGEGVATHLYVPVGSIVRRVELDGVYIVDAQGGAILRQVRLGRAQGERIEILSGVQAGERVAIDPQAAARAH